MTAVIFNGAPAGPFAELPQHVHGMGLATALLINLVQDADAAIAAADAFAKSAPAGKDALVINVLHAHDRSDWGGTSAAAILWAFTRYAALAWAPRRIRVNALSLGPVPFTPDQRAEGAARAASPAPSAAVTPADIAATVLAMCRLRSMTGQMIRLGSALP